MTPAHHPPYRVSVNPLPQVDLAIYPHPHVPRQVFTVTYEVRTPDGQALTPVLVNEVLAEEARQRLKEEYPGCRIYTIQIEYDLGRDEDRGDLIALFDDAWVGRWEH